MRVQNKILKINAKNEVSFFSVVDRSNSMALILTFVNKCHVISDIHCTLLVQQLDINKMKTIYHNRYKFNFEEKKHV